MLKKAALLVALVLLTGCSDGDETEPSPVASETAEAEPVGDPPVGDPSVEAEDPSGTLASVGEEGDWDAFIEACKNPEQEALVQLVTTGDLTGDGTADALVARTCDASTSYFPSTIEVFDGASPAAEPVRVGAPILTDAGPTDQPWVIGMAVKEQVVTVTAYGTGGTDSNACPKLKLTYRYLLDGGAFEQVDRAATTSADCLAIA
ncbi:hypothetical protein [Actinoplanes derwentensis]|uniref:Uncharacterized protein n=1 Tax=Actinoplanes derwentensis TaxID=113562 RepID=A0A1H2B3K7_9ACTN|nr:hypothetical protein [Actinoplanes derwentensis]SDT52539.1 hypothetical protein SAMN04489716_4295 [Actinoplanes derwentensis]